jgi:Ca-activated chloride channel family protein
MRNPNFTSLWPRNPFVALILFFTLMTLFRQFSLFEGILSFLFLFFYIIYIAKVIRVGKTLNTPSNKVFIKLFLRTAIFALLLLSFLGPTFGDSKKEIKSIGKDIMICVDLSKSMEAFDVQPTRLEKVKFEMKKIVESFNSDRLGVIIFSSEAFMQCPLTFDQNALNLFIETMNTNLVPSAGTDFAPPLSLALKKLTEQEQTTSSQQKSKIIVLISDGEDFGEETSEITKEIEDKDIKLFTLGVGTETGSKISSGIGFKKDQSGNAVISKLNSSSLKALASKTGGQYFEINENRNDVSKLINTISKIEGELRDTRFVDVSANRYFYFLLAALGLLIFDLLIQIKTVRI